MTFLHKFTVPDYFVLLPIVVKDTSWMRYIAIWILLQTFIKEKHDEILSQLWGKIDSKKSINTWCNEAEYKRCNEAEYKWCNEQRLVRYNANAAIYQVAQPPVLHETFHIYKYIHLRYLPHRLTWISAICIGDWQLSTDQDVVAITCLLPRPESHRLHPHQSSTWPWPRSPTAPGPGRFIQFHLFSSSFINAPLRGRNQATVECFGSFTNF